MGTACGGWQAGTWSSWMGRMDFQVKINGMRIELGDIEAVLRQYAGIRDAAVLVRKSPSGNEQLVGYVLPVEADIEGARMECSRLMLVYMVPGMIVAMEEWPMTSSGKLDRKLLPDPDCAPSMVVPLAIPHFSFKFVTLARLLNLSFFLVLWTVEETTLLPMMTRAMGSKIGSNVYFDAQPPVEMDILEIGNDTIIEKTHIIPHVIDYGNLQFAPVCIGAICVLQTISLLMPGVTLVENAVLAPGTVAAKEESFPSNTTWSGNFATCIKDRSSKTVELN
eukprot:gene1979-2665_t